MSERTAALIPAEARLRGIAREYGIAEVFHNPALLGTKTMAQLITFQGEPPVIELRPDLDWLTRLLAVLHEIGHKVRGDEMAEDPDYRLAKLAIRFYHQYRDAGNPASQGFEDLYREEERIVNSWAFWALIHHFGPRYGRVEDFEARGFVFQHREP